MKILAVTEIVVPKHVAERMDDDADGQVLSILTDKSIEAIAEVMRSGRESLLSGIHVDSEPVESSPTSPEPEEHSER